MVHGLGVGAFTLDAATPIHAPYSCRGPGRECGKLKPDLTAFGGCENMPIHLASTVSGKKTLLWGTSFAAPIMARLNAQAIDSFERSTALLGRTLLVHAAEIPGSKADAKKSDFFRTWMPA